MNDFVNLAFQLRTVPELIAYLNARQSLPLSSLRVVGEERCLLELYFLQNGTLAGCVGHSDAKIVVASHSLGTVANAFGFVNSDGSGQRTLGSVVTDKLKGHSLDCESDKAPWQVEAVLIRAEAISPSLHYRIHL